MELATTTLAPVTAVVPTHRRPELMREAVASIVNQDYRGPIEIIVVFDACDIDVPEIEESDLRSIRGIANQRTRGLAGARNTGIVEAAHGYVAFLDDDDVWLPGKLTAQMALFAEHPEVGLVGTAMQVDDGHKLHDRLVPTDLVTHDQLLGDRFAGLHSSSFVFRRTHLVDIGMIDEDLPGSYGEDYDVLLQSAAIAPLRLVNEPLVTVRWQGQSFYFGRWGEYATALQYLLERHPGFASHRHGLARIQSQVAFGLAADGQRKSARSWARKSLRGKITGLRAWFALAISFRLISADRIGRVANRFGKGI